MKLVTKLFFTLLANIAGILGAWYWVPGFSISTVGIKEIVALAAALAILNFFLKPLIKLVLGPFILLTLGVGLLVVNSLMLYLLDTLSKNLTIEGIPALVYSTIVISVINFVIHLVIKS